MEKQREFEPFSDNGFLAITVTELQKLFIDIVQCKELLL
jgi:hypothetical protein